MDEAQVCSRQVALNVIRWCSFSSESAKATANAEVKTGSAAALWTTPFMIGADDP